MPHNPAGADKSEGRGACADWGGVRRREDEEDEGEEAEGRSQQEEIAVADWSVFCLACRPVVCCIT